MNVNNHDAGLLALAVIRGHCSADRAQALQAQRRGRSMAIVLVEDGGIAPAIVRALRDEQGRQSIPSRIGPYQLTEHLGNGGMSVVFKALDHDTGTFVAVKLLSPRTSAQGTAKTRFDRESRSGLAIDHPRVIRCLDHGEVNHHSYHILEYMAGGDAAALMARNGGRLPPQQALTLIRDCADGLAAIHAAGMMHRDIKPANIFIDGDGRAKLADLGLARHVEDDDHLTMPGHCLGTPCYMSPEQARGLADIDGRTDIYSLGATLYHFITGRPPYPGTAPRAVIMAVLNEPVPNPRALVPDLDPVVADLIVRALAKERSGRPQDAASLIAALDAVLQPHVPAIKGTSVARSRRAWVLRIFASGRQAWRRFLTVGRPRHARFPR